MTGQKLVDSEGAPTHSEGTSEPCVETVRTQSTTFFSLNRLGLAAQLATPWLRAGRGTQGGRGDAKKESRKYRFPVRRLRP